jgi:vacuolar-type H+-ATPase subunit H
MSGLETVKIIVETEKEAAKILELAKVKASDITKQVGATIEKQREEVLRSAKEEASGMLRRAEADGKVEAQQLEQQSEGQIQEIVRKATSRKDSAVTKMLEIFLK